MSWAITEDGKSGVNLAQATSVRIMPSSLDPADGVGVVADGMGGNLGRIVLASGLSEEAAKGLIEILAERAQKPGTLFVADVTAPAKERASAK